MYTVEIICIQSTVKVSIAQTSYQLMTSVVACEVGWITFPFSSTRLVVFYLLSHYGVGLVVLLSCVHGLHYGYTGLQCLLHYLLVHTKSLLMDIHMAYF